MQESLESAHPAIPISLSSCIFHCDSFELIQSQPPGFCHHIVTDPDGNNIPKLLDFIPLAFRAIAEKGFFAFFYPVSKHETICQALLSAGFLYQPYPIITCQMDYMRIHNVNPDHYFPPSYETIMLARKPGTVLAKRQGQGFYTYSAKASRIKFGSIFSRPVAIWNWIYRGIAIPGQIIYDPFAGSGTSFIAASRNLFCPIASEHHKESYDLMLNNVKEDFRARLGQNLNFI